MVAISGIAKPVNEPNLDYSPGSPERGELEERLGDLEGRVIEIPAIVSGEERRPGEAFDVVMPHKHGHVLAEGYLADKGTIEEAIESSLEAKADYLELPADERASIFMRAAELLSGPWRATMNAATMLGLSKTVYEAEIDTAELIDMLRFNASWMAEIRGQQPLSVEGVRNRVDYRPLDGFVLAITPFNFTSIAGNLPTAPAIMGNVVVWKPATSALYCAYFFMRVLREAGLPDGVINFVPARGSLVGEVALGHRDLGGVHFTGSASTMRYLWRRIARNIGSYRQYPRLVGETGGKGFVFAHESAEIDALATGLIRGAFGYQGQKCSAASRAYIPRAIWPGVREKLIGEMATIKVGDPTDFSNYMGAIIDGGQYNRILEYIEEASTDDNYEILAGGGHDGDVGYFIEPTLVTSRDPGSRLMREEIFGPILTVYVYDESYVEALRLCDETSPYGLTGGIFASDVGALDTAERVLRFAAGNFYRNDKPTGAVVAQQPFGGSRGSGTNDKAGSPLNLLRWTSVRTIKENLDPPRDYRRPFMGGVS
jgi:1-pyrroline-5-carboxylate dehydrogenase